jgi:hypothetical protein
MRYSHPVTQMRAQQTAHSISMVLTFLQAQSAQRLALIPLTQALPKLSSAKFKAGLRRFGLPLLRFLQH